MRCIKSALPSFSPDLFSLEGLLVSPPFGGGGVQGMTAPLIAAMFENAIAFTAYSRFQAVIQKDVNEPQMLGTVLSGGGSGFFTAALLTPVELVKCRLQVCHLTPALTPFLTASSSKQVQEKGRAMYAGPIDCVRQTLRNEGFRSFYTGHFATMLREIPGPTPDSPPARPCLRPRPRLPPSILSHVHQHLSKSIEQAAWLILERTNASAK